MKRLPVPDEVVVRNTYSGFDGDVWWLVIAVAATFYYYYDKYGVFYGLAATFIIWWVIFTLIYWYGKYRNG